jgi:N-acylneuraminate cytidylyltransferase
MRRQGFVQARHRFFGKTAFYVMPLDRCLEIDEPVDFLVAQVLIRERQRQRQLRALPASVEALVLDFDGVFTDNRVIVFQDGREAVICDRSDGWGVARLGSLGVAVFVLSAEENPVVDARCAKLGIACSSGVRDKLVVLREWLAEKHIDRSRVVYVGNDVSDLPCLRAVGCGVAVQDAHPLVQRSAKLILYSAGGRGAVREICDLVREKIGDGR